MFAFAVLGWPLGHCACWASALSQAEISGPCSISPTSACGAYVFACVLGVASQLVPSNLCLSRKCCHSFIHRAFCPSSLLLFFCFEKLSNFETMLAWNSWSSCLSLPDTGIAGVSHHTLVGMHCFKDRGHPFEMNHQDI